MHNQGVKLEGSTALILGATGNVGWGAALALLEDGARLIVVSRDQARAADLPGQLGALERVTSLVADLGVPEGARSLVEQIAARGLTYDHVFASMGPWWQKGPIVEQSAEEYRAVMRASLDCHVFAAQALIPPLRERPGSSYTIITGAGGHATIPGTGLLVIAVNGVFGLSRMLRAEHAGDPMRVNELLIQARIERTPRSGVVASARFGAAAVAIAGSELRGQVLRYDSPEQFQAGLDAGR